MSLRKGGLYGRPDVDQGSAPMFAYGGIDWAFGEKEFIELDIEMEVTIP